MKRSFRVLLTPLTYVHVGQAHRFGADIDAPRASAHPMQNRAHGVIETLRILFQSVSICVYLWLKNQVLLSTLQANAFSQQIEGCCGQSRNESNNNRESHSHMNI